MNLNSTPTLDELVAIFTAADDEAGHHTLWVDKSGNVHLTQVPDDLTPVGLEARTPAMKMRYETFGQGNDYVGPDAAEDEELMNKIFQSLVKEWGGKFEADRVKYVDQW